MAFAQLSNERLRRRPHATLLAHAADTLRHAGQSPIRSASIEHFGHGVDDELVYRLPGGPGLQLSIGGEIVRKPDGDGAHNWIMVSTQRTGYGLIDQAQNAWPPGGRRFSVVYNTYIMRRTQIYLDDGQVAQLRAASTTSAKSVSEIIRDAIDEKLARVGEVDDFERALAAIAGIWADRGDIGSTDDYVRKVRQDRRGAPTP